LNRPQDEDGETVDRGIGAAGPAAAPEPEDGQEVEGVAAPTKNVPDLQNLVGLTVSLLRRPVLS
jgi:hypothetical protein